MNSEYLKYLSDKEKPIELLLEEKGPLIEKYKIRLDFFQYIKEMGVYECCLKGDISLVFDKEKKGFVLPPNGKEQKNELNACFNALIENFKEKAKMAGLFLNVQINPRVELGSKESIDRLSFQFYIEGKDNEKIKDFLTNIEENFKKKRQKVVEVSR